MGGLGMNPLLAQAGMGMAGLSLGGSAMIPSMGGGMGAGPMMGGLNMGGLGGMGLPSIGAGIGIGGMGQVSGLSNVIMVTNLPLALEETQVKELVGTFGEVKAFNLIKSAGLSQSAVLEYTNSAVTDEAILGLNKLEIADFKLAVQRVPLESAAILLQPSSTSVNAATATAAALTNLLTNQSQSATTPTLPIIDPTADPLITLQPTRILRLSNMTMPEDLIDDEAYSELQEDVLEECSKYGQIVSIEIPRPVQAGGDPGMYNSNYNSIHIYVKIIHAYTVYV